MLEGAKGIVVMLELCCKALAGVRQSIYCDSSIGPGTAGLAIVARPERAERRGASYVSSPRLR